MITTIPFPKPRVGEPVRHESLSVFPLFLQRTAEIDYRLSDEALADKSLLVEEVSEGGSVPELLVRNNSEQRVLFLEGEELVGAKQNRVLNTSVLMAAHSQLKIPVSCVEQGRWDYKSCYFESSGSHSPTNLRRALKKSVSKSVRAQKGHRSDQGKVWSEVAALNATHRVTSRTTAMSDAFAAYECRIVAFRDHLDYIEGAVGLAVAIGDRVLSVDWFDKASTCRRVWPRLLSGVVFDALEAGDSDRHAEPEDVEKLIERVSVLSWERGDAVGEGEEYRAESPQGDQASMLTLDDVVVHGSLVGAR